MRSRCSAVSDVTLSTPVRSRIAWLVRRLAISCRTTPTTPRRSGPAARARAQARARAPRATTMTTTKKPNGKGPNNGKGPGKGPGPKGNDNDDDKTARAQARARAPRTASPATTTKNNQTARALGTTARARALTARGERAAAQLLRRRLAGSRRSGEGEYAQCDGTAPICCNKPSISGWPRSSTNLPLERR
jgi:hypothetical protein